MMRAPSRAMIAAAAVAVAVSAAVHAQVTPGPATPKAWELRAEREVGPIRIVPVRDDVYLLASAEGNSTVQAGPQGTVVVDTISAKMAPELVKAIETLSPRPILQIINTNSNRTGGNETVRLAGRAVRGGIAAGEGAPVLAFESVLQRLIAGKAPQGVWPSDTYFVASKDMYFNGEAVHVYHQPAAYSDGDTLVLFRRSDVVVAGDVFVPGGFPRIDQANGGSINGVVAGLNRIIDLTVPEVNEEGGTMVVPAVGRLTDEADVGEYRDMVTIVRDRVQDMVAKRMTLQQVLASKPTRDYDPAYGTAAYTGEMFVEAVFRSLSAAGTQEKGR